MAQDGNEVEVREDLILDKWEGEAEAEGSYIVERLWIEDGEVVGHMVAEAPGDIAPFSINEPLPQPPKEASNATD